MTSAVVFGYGEVGIRCLAALRARNVRVPLIVTHAADPAESGWHGSLETFAAARGSTVLIAETLEERQLETAVASSAPDFVFSFYYRRMLPSAVLRQARVAALNVHGSLLPKYRGRAPINWAILNGETVTGATLHYMTEKPDAGDIVAQRAFPIFPDDIAVDVFRNVCAAAESMIYDTMPQLEDGTATRIPQRAAEASYFGRRTPEDGRIDWSRDSTSIHNLVRAVAPPYPGALTHWNERPARILRTLTTAYRDSQRAPGAAFALEGRCLVQCGDHRALQLLEVEVDGHVLNTRELAVELGRQPARLGAGLAA